MIRAGIFDSWEILCIKGVARIEIESHLTSCNQQLDQLCTADGRARTCFVGFETPQDKDQYHYTTCKIE